MRRSRRTLGVAVSAGLLLVGSLAGCSSPTESYCSTLKDDKARLEKLSGQSDEPTTAVLEGSLRVFEDLQDAAPQDVAGDWDDFVFAWRSLVDAFAASGVDPSTFMAGKQPEGVSKSELEAIRQAAAELQSEPVTLAARRIEDHARTICKVDLGGSGLGGM